MSPTSFRIGVRANRLGRSLGERIAEQLRSHLGSTPITFVSIGEETSGPGAGAPWPGAPLSRAVAKGEVDIAVQNVKEMDPELEPGLSLAAVAERVTPFDVLIARDEMIFDELPEEAEISAHSAIRRAQLLRYRDDLKLVDAAADLAERIHLLDAGDLDGIVVSASAVEHLGFQDRVTEIFTTEMVLPGAGQGACAVVARQNAKETLRLVKHLEHPVARSEVESERAFLRELKADPGMAVGALASIEGSTIRLEGAVADPSGRKLVRDVEEGESGDEEQIGARLARRLLLEGAKRILAGAATHPR
jgi:hydroxymethylbilane synthase